ncbi:DUF6423 family protein [Arcanobacterium phocae]|nr:DUF6423 family protein [Arcanobacterium phocae]
MAAVAFLETRTVFISGALETSDRAVMVTYDLPSEGRWTMIKTETNLSDQVWKSWIMSVDQDGRFIDEPSRPNRSMQFSQVAMSHDSKRLGFFDGEVRPGESILKQFTIESPSRRFYMSHGKRANPNALPSEAEILNEIEYGYDLDPAYEIFVPVEIRF